MGGTQPVLSLPAAPNIGDWFEIESTDSNIPWKVVGTGAQKFSGPIDMRGPGGTRALRHLAVTADGENIASSLSPGKVVTSTDSGVTWQEQAAAPDTIDHLAAAANGSLLVAKGETSDYLHRSLDWGQSWSTSSFPSTIGGFAVSDNGQRLAVIMATEHVRVSTDGGQSWNTTSSGALMWRSVAVSGDGSTIVAGACQGKIHISNDFGTNWTEVASLPTRCWDTIGISQDGSTIFALPLDDSQPFSLYRSTNSGALWSEVVAAGSRYWLDLAVSPDGATIVASDLEDIIDPVIPRHEVKGIRLSTDGGATWTLASPGVKARTIRLDAAGQYYSVGGPKMLLNGAASVEHLYGYGYVKLVYQASGEFLVESSSGAIVGAD